MPSKNIPIVVLGGSGYVAGELMRLLLQHPSFELCCVVSGSSAGELIAETFPHLAPALAGQRFVTASQAMEFLEAKRTLGLFSALPHGESAVAIAEWVNASQAAGCELKIVDLSSDFRYSNAAQYEAIYGKPHGAPQLLSGFACALPDTKFSPSGNWVSHPGCFTTSVVLALTPLFEQELVEPNVMVSSVTGSTGAGRQPRPGTHHPERHGGLWAYEPLRHRHQPEMEALIEQSSRERPSIAFAPHSGPFSRGIHSSLFATLKPDQSEATVKQAISAYYEGSPFVSLRENWPSVKDVVGTNGCHLSVRTEGNRLFIASVIDNLTKGAAGGGVQWMNQLFAYEISHGLLLPGLGWS